jgi:regulatory protein
VGMKVTAIERAIGGAPRLAVFIDGREAFTVSEDLASRLGLRVGAEVGEEDARELRADSERVRARESALRLLAVRARSRSELADRLARKGLEPGVVSEVLDGLEEVGLIDDRAFARLWVDERLRLRPVGPRRLVHELSEKGVTREVIDEVVAEAFSEEREIDVARRAVEKRAARAGGRLDARELQRIRSLLLRRGFSFEVTREVLEGLSGGTDG